AETTDTARRDAQRFTLRSFQQVSLTEGREVERLQYLEKYYVGQEEDPTQGREESVLGDRAAGPEDAEAARRRKDADKPRSFIAKLASKEDGEGRPSDRGRGWAEHAIGAFRKRTKRSRKDDELWAPFLHGLTADYRRLRGEEETQSGQELHWFFFRLGLLRLVLPTVRKEKEFEVVRDGYLDTVKLMFDDDRNLDVLDLAGQLGQDLFALVADKQKTSA